MVNYSVVDVETNGLLYEQGDKPIADVAYCMAIYEVKNGVGKSYTLVDYDEMRQWLKTQKYIIGHNFKRYDKPVLEKLLGVTITCEIIDTLALSWYLYPNREKHGLEKWGETLNIEKPKVTDWINGELETYVYRCQEDVRINNALWDLQWDYLIQLYNDDKDEAIRLIRYLMFKMDCAVEQEEQMWRLDIDKCKTTLAKFKEEEAKKVEILSSLMPNSVKTKPHSRPDKLYKKDGSISVAGEKWFNLLKEKGLPDYHTSAVEVIVSEEDGNPGSYQQIKAWLFSLGWIPDYYKAVKSKKTKEIKQVPQIQNQDGDDVCDSIKALYDKVPDLVAIEGLYVLRHRIGILEGFLERVNSKGYLQAQVKGLTNTLRFQHTTIVNLPQIPKPYWEEVRSCLITDEGYELCGSDMSGLEDNTKHHYMYYFDPEYVKQMRTPGFDPHIDISVRAKGISYDEGEFYKWYDRKKEYDYIPTDEFVPTANSCLKDGLEGIIFPFLTMLSDEDQTKAAKVIKPLRLKFKKGNFASVYGAGPKKLAITMSISIQEAAEFHRAYWIRNAAVKKVADSCRTKVIGGQAWLYNPVSKFWYSLREMKDRFSTLNQGTGVYCFDTWVSHVRKFGIKMIGQFHDEIIFRLPLNTREEHRVKLIEAIKLTNEQVNLNVPLKISIDFGDNYAAIH